MIGIAYAMGPGGAPGQGAGGSLTPFIPLILMFIIFYFLLIRPQQKKAKEHQEMLKNLKKGDKIMTSGGIHGRITGQDGTVLTVEIAEKVRIKMDSSYVGALLQKGSQSDSQELKTK